MDSINIVFTLTVLTNRFVEAIFQPIFEKYNLDKFWLMYIAWAIAGVLVFLSGVNVFSEILQSQTAGQVLTSMVAGGGANILHDLLDRK